MILGIGIDIIDIPRVERIAGEYGEDIITRVFTEDEIAYCQSKKNSAINFAGRFAAKEAFLKALGTGLRGGIEWRDISVVCDELGKPSIALSGKTKETADAREVKKVHVSISHTAENATAVVILEG
ncbi:MAG TPA: holo-ACP synthase [candidate division Zixibacteria bacterium]|nr:holo-ACP synthase [candidate division Zixibacteria bacterium]